MNKKRLLCKLGFHKFEHLDNFHYDGTVERTTSNIFFNVNNKEDIKYKLFDRVKICSECLKVKHNIKTDLDDYEIKEWVKGKYLFAFDLVKDKYIETFKKQESV